MNISLYSEVMDDPHHHFHLNQQLVKVSFCISFSLFILSICVDLSLIHSLSFHINEHSDNNIHSYAIIESKLL